LLHVARTLSLAAETALAGGYTADTQLTAKPPKKMVNEKHV
jgi:uncharacterized membrane protein YeiH